MDAVLNIILTLFWAIIGFGVLVFIHEFGHMIVGLATGIGVEQFSIGFGPALVKFNIKGIDFKLSAIPFGGYCQFKGQEDFGKNQSDKEPDDFYARPAWSRLLTVIAGPVFNIIIAIIIFTILFSFPTKVIGNQTIVVNKLFQDEIELKTGDKVLAINDKKIKYGHQIEQIKVNKFEEEITFTVLRNGEEIKVNYTPSFKRIEKGIQEITIGDINHPIVRSVLEGYPAEKAGLKEGDKIVSIDGKEISLSSSISYVLENTDKTKVNITVLRDGVEKEFTIKPVEEEGRKIVGITSTNITNPEYVELDRNIGQAFIEGVNESYNAVWTTIKGLGLLFSGQADVAKNVSGPIAIFGMVGTVGANQSFYQYIYLIGLISVLLGFFNLLPIPAVDGGHIVLSLIEIIRGKPLNMKIIQAVQVIGIVLILSLFVIVTIKDILNLPEFLNMFK